MEETGNGKEFYKKLTGGQDSDLEHVNSLWILLPSQDLEMVKPVTFEYLMDALGAPEVPTQIEEPWWILMASGKEQVNVF